MREGLTASLTLGALVVLTVAAAVASRQLSGLDARISEVIQTKRTTTMATLEEEVTRTDGRKTKLITQQRDDETPEQHIARHDVYAARLKATP